jgi:protein arginine N-methyltransferase 5
MYLPARSELDVQMWRLTDDTKRRVWFEWSCSAYLPAQSLSFIPTPPGSATSGTFSAGLRPGAFSPTPSTPGGHHDAFQSAPSPMLATSHDGRMPGIAEEEGATTTSSTSGIHPPVGGVSGEQQRILISMSKLHNGAGKFSWIGL